LYRLLSMLNNCPLISINGVFDAVISPLDRGFAYGDGVFETCRYSCGKIPLWDFHCERLIQSAERLKIPLDQQLLAKYLTAILVHPDLVGVDNAVVKITLTRGIGGRGYRLPDNAAPTYCVSVFSGVDLRSANFSQGITARICELRLASSKYLAGMKHLNRLEHILARSEWQDEFAEGLLFDVDNYLIEGTVSNVFVIKENQLFTPDLGGAGVAGVMRRAIIERLLPALALDCHVIQMDMDFLLNADEVFLCNSVYGIWPVNKLVDDRVPDCITTTDYELHRLTHRIQQQFVIWLGEQ
jgi:4-amino-4-deoxychorismate lyase